MVIEQPTIEYAEDNQSSLSQQSRKRHFEDNIFTKLSGTNSPKEIAKHKAKSIAEAIKKGFFKQIRFLIEIGYDVNQKEDAQEFGKRKGQEYCGRSPLILCSLIRGDDWGVGIAQNLLERGAKVGIKNLNGMNALHYACIFVRSKLVW